MVLVEQGLRSSRDGRIWRSGLAAAFREPTIPSQRPGCDALAAHALAALAPLAVAAAARGRRGAGLGRGRSDRGAEGGEREQALSATKEGHRAHF